MINIDINLIFQIINLCIITVFIIRYLIRSVFPDFKQQMDKDEFLQENLKRNIQDLENLQDKVKFDIDQQKVLCENLQSKVSLWNSNVSASIEKHAEKEEEIKKQLQEKINYQAKQIAMKRTEMQVAPLVHKALIDYAEEHFQDIANQKDYIHGIFNYLDKYK